MSQQPNFMITDTTFIQATREGRRKRKPDGRNGLWLLAVENLEQEEGQAEKDSVNQETDAATSRPLQQFLTQSITSLLTLTTAISNNIF